MNKIESQDKKIITKWWCNEYFSVTLAVNTVPEKKWKLHIFIKKNNKNNIILQSNVKDEEKI